jgi:hypothetical protein
VTALDDAAEPSAADGKAAINPLRLGLVEESADPAIPFLIGVREAARAGDVARARASLRALWLAVLTMKQAFKEIAFCGEGAGNG